ncbi:hypothetical protein [Paenibacillus sp. NAIST15-1]|nr:hypothetical protein [Paenibacillus sp. NAIST15-1]
MLALSSASCNSSIVMNRLVQAEIIGVNEMDLNNTHSHEKDVRTWL